MSPTVVPFDRYPGLSPLFLEFLRGLPDFFPDPPTIAAASARGKQLLGAPSRVPPSAWQCRGAEAQAAGRALSEGRAVAAVAGHQVGLFTGPLYTLTKAFDTQRVARQIAALGVPAAPVFWALTDDHDLEEVGKIAWPGPQGPEVLALDGADRANRHPVGGLPVPDRATQILEAFRATAKASDADETATAFARRYAPGATYAEAFIETLLDLVEPEPLLVLDPDQEVLRGPITDFFALAVERREKLHEALRGAAQRLEREGKPVPVPYRPDVFPFFLIEGGERRRVTDPEEALRKVRSGAARASTDVLTRPVLKSFLLPTAAAVLGAAEIAYHAQSIPLFQVFGLTPPVLLPRSHLVLLGPPERRLIESLGIAPGDLLTRRPDSPAAPVAQAAAVGALAKALVSDLMALEPRLKELDPALVTALETTRQKATYPLEQLQERIRKAAERNTTTNENRQKKLETMLLPNGVPAERLYSPLLPLLTFGREALAEVRAAATGSTAGAELVQLGAAVTGDADGEGHAG